VSSRYTRIILMGEDEQGLREFTISHTMVRLLVVLLVLLVAAVIGVFATWGWVSAEAQRARDLRNDLASARMQLAAIDTLEAELVTMASMQQQLLHMLGVDQTPVDTLPPGEATLPELAAVVMAPRPDAWPADGYITREFTEGRPNVGERPHLGLDIAGPEGAPILAAGDGSVVRTGSDPYLGNFVEIQHGMGYLTVYGHCREVAVARGARVSAGQLVAYMGQTGEATAPHLHFEVWHNGMAVDPRLFLEGEPRPRSND
jgi:murein DD-endopeptidase MepM/ murein hydrolase activator NlpD